MGPARGLDADKPSSASRRLASSAGVPGFKPQLCCFAAVWHWGNSRFYSTTLERRC